MHQTVTYLTSTISMAHNNATDRLMFDRGFTGHSLSRYNGKHLAEFGLIDMFRENFGFVSGSATKPLVELIPKTNVVSSSGNGRACPPTGGYDPQAGLFLSPDPYVQNPLNSQNFNRYGYCLNNPLIYTDPTGEKWNKKHWTALADFLTGGAISATSATLGSTVAAFLVPTATQAAMIGDPVGDATWAWCAGVIDELWSGGNIGEAFAEGDRRAYNSWKISYGQLIADPDDGGGFWEVLSRLTWQQPVTMVGNELAQFTNHTARVEVDYFHGATVLQNSSLDGVGAYSFGGYIFIEPGSLDYSNSLLLHEYGHFLQTRGWGSFTIASSMHSLMDALFHSPETHDKLWVERDANARALQYFEGRKSFETNSTNYSDFIESTGGDWSNRENIGFYDDRFIRWWYFLFPDPIYGTLNNIYFNPR